MIHVDRSAVSAPSALLTDGAAEMRMAEQFFKRPPKERRRDRFMFLTQDDPTVLGALLTLFASKCAYCETAMPVNVIRHRPADGVVLDSGRLLPNHYWWLANTWENLYLACAACQRHWRPAGRTASALGSRFPLSDETRRARVGSSYPNVLAREAPLVLDPCIDQPHWHLVFRSDGTVDPITARGEHTIALLGLDRPDLEDARREVGVAATRQAKRIRQEISRLNDRRGLAGEIAELTDAAHPAQPHSAVVRQVVTELYDDLQRNGDDWFANLLQNSGLQPPPAPASGFRATNRPSFSLEALTDADDAAYRRSSRYIARVRIRNVKAIRNVDLDLTRTTSTGAPWTVLLGENGSGKSTILQALAIALVGEDEVERLQVDPTALLRDQAPTGHIEVWMTGAPEPRVVVIHPDRLEFTGTAEAHQLVLGYGETRLLPSPELPGAEGTRSQRVEGLFRPARTLVPPREALLNLPEAHFEYVAGAFRSLLEVDGSWLQRSKRDVWVREGGQRRPISALSTGYQSMVATVVDILQLTLQLWPTPESAAGIVLIDELGAHLHPRWRMRVVSGLRAMLPSVQFIATTHEPLCLRGLEEHEVVLMQRERNTAFATTDLPSPRDLRVDQLLTSRYFGLSTTLDPELDAEFDAYYDLLGRGDALAPAEVEVRDQLARKLNGHGVLGYTRRDQLAYEAIDRYLADERRAERAAATSAPNASQAAAREKVLRDVGELWRLAQDAEAGAP